MPYWLSAGLRPHMSPSMFELWPMPLVKPNGPPPGPALGAAGAALASIGCSTKSGWVVGAPALGAAVAGAFALTGCSIKSGCVVGVATVADPPAEGAFVESANAPDADSNAAIAAPERARRRRDIAARATGARRPTETD